MNGKDTALVTGLIIVALVAVIGVFAILRMLGML